MGQVRVGLVGVCWELCRGNHTFAPCTPQNAAADRVNVSVSPNCLALCCCSEGADKLALQTAAKPASDVVSIFVLQMPVLGSNTA